MMCYKTHDEVVFFTFLSKVASLLTSMEGTVVIDNGSSHVKIGIAETGEYGCIPCFISRIRPGASKRPDERDLYFTSGETLTTQIQSAQSNTV